MKKLLFIITALFFTQISLFTGSAVFADNAAIDRPVKTAIRAIQMQRYDLASRQLDYTIMGQIVMGQFWSQMTDSQQKEMIAGIETLIKKISFTRGTEMFKHLSTIHYGKPAVQGSKATIRTTVVVYQNYKKAEIVMDFELRKTGDQWKIVEISMLGEPVLGGIHIDEIKPMVKKGGIEQVMQAMRAQIAQTK